MLYLASPYSHEDALIMKTRFLLAEQVTAFLMQKGEHVYSPIVHCHEIAQKYVMPTDFDYWRSYNFSMIRRCDAFAILTIDGWDRSKGVTGEGNFARECGLPFAHVDEMGVIRWQK